MESRRGVARRLPRHRAAVYALPVTAEQWNASTTLTGMTMTEAIRWKHGARCAVTLSFDVDGETPWIYRDKALADRPLHMSMGAYGPKTGVPRILALLDRYDIKAGFFIPGWIVERYPDLCKEIVRRGHEIGHHGYLHEKPFFLESREQEEELLIKSMEIFRQVLGVTP